MGQPKVRLWRLVAVFTAEYVVWILVLPAASGSW